MKKAGKFIVVVLSVLICSILLLACSNSEKPIIPPAEEEIPSSVSYTLTFDSSGGSKVSPIKSDSQTGKVVRPSNPIFIGYTFLDWYETVELLKEFDFTKIIEKDTIVYAGWSKNLNKVNFNGNGSTSGNMKSIDASIDEAVLLPKNVFERIGYTFIGWALTVDGSIKNVDEGWYLAGAEATQTLFAKWQANKYKITFDKCGGEGGDNQVSVTYGSALTYAKSPALAGFVFGGYFTELNGKGVQYYNSNMASSNNWDIDKDVTVYAFWETALNSLIFDGNGSSEGETNPISGLTHTEVTIPNCGYLKKGYIFDSWNTLDGGKGDRYNAGDIFTIYASFDPITMFAIWTPNNYSVKFMGNNGSGENFAGEYTYDVIKELGANLFAKTGYFFSGWNTKADGAGKHYSEREEVKNLSEIANAEILLYAEWSPNTYTVTLNKQGGMGGNNSVQATFDNVLGFCVAPSRVGYTFGGYFIGADGAGLQYYDSSMLGVKVYDFEENLVLYAKWSAKSSSVIFDKNGADNGSTASIETFTSQDVKLPVCGFSKVGYIFYGWNTRADGKGIFWAEGDKYNVIASDDAIIFFAIWKERTTNIIFNGNGNTDGAMSQISGKTYDTLTLTACGFTRNGYKFVGWTTELNGGGDKYSEGAEYIIQPSDYAFNLYADWEIIVYSITYNLSGGTNAKVNPFEYTVESKTITLSDPTRKGYEFLSWGKDNQINSGSVGDKVFIADWKRLEYDIIYVLTNGQNNKDNPISYNVESPTIIIKDPFKLGATFEGWAEGNIIEQGSLGNRTFTADWNGKRYGITYDLGGGLNGDGNPGSYMYDSETITLKDAVKKGFVFKGWTEGNTIPKNSEGDRKFTAKWERITYKINYNLNGGTNSNSNPKSYNVESDDIVLSDPKKSGYIFDGWEEGSLLESGNIGDKTFTASWSIISYNIIYVLEDGVNHPDNPDSYNFLSGEIVLKDPTRENYKFLCWMEGDSEDCNNIPQGSTGDRRFVAIWEKVAFTIVYELGEGGINDIDNPLTYTVESGEITLKAPTRENYKFLYWTVDGIKSNKIQVGSIGNKQVVAVWEAVEYTITYELGEGGINDIDNPLTYTIESGEIRLEKPSRIGYLFVEWEQGETILTGSSGDKTFTAIWIEDTENPILRQK